MKNKNLIIFSVAFVLVIVFGLLINSGIENERTKLAEEKELEKLMTLLPDLGVDKIVEVNQKNFKSNDQTKIVKRYNGMKGKDIVGIIYVGETKGYKEGLNVAFGINTANDKIVGMEILQNQETDRFLVALKEEEFFKQFASKDLSKYLLTVDVVTGPTPNSGKDGVIAPATSGGVEKVMLLVREQYAEDTKFEMPSGLVFVSKSLDYTNTDQFKYVFKLGETNINVVVNKNYEIVSIDDETQRDAALEIINLPANKFTNYIVSDTISDGVTTLVVRAQAYSSTYVTTTFTIEGGVVTNVDLKYSAPQTYDDEHNEDYTGGNFDSAPADLKNNIDINPVTGATYTYNGLKVTQEILRGYLEANR